MYTLFEVLIRGPSHYPAKLKYINAIFRILTDVTNPALPSNSVKQIFAFPPQTSSEIYVIISKTVVASVLLFVITFCVQWRLSHKNDG